MRVKNFYYIGVSGEENNLIFFFFFLKLLYNKVMIKIIEMVKSAIHFDHVAPMCLWHNNKRKEKLGLCHNRQQKLACGMWTYGEDTHTHWGHETFPQLFAILLSTTSNSFKKSVHLHFLALHCSLDPPKPLTSS